MDFQSSIFNPLAPDPWLFLFLFYTLQLDVTKFKLYFQYINHIIGFWARLCPSFLTFHQGPVKPRSLSETHKLLLVIYIPA